MKRRRSPLYGWLEDHYAEIAPVIAAQRRPSWEALAQTARESGQKGPVDGGPSRQTVRKAWFRLLADMERSKAQEASVIGEASPAMMHRQRAPSHPGVPSAASPVVAAPDYDARPRERKRMVLRSPVPLAEGEPAPNDGSRLPAPLRPETK